MVRITLAGSIVAAYCFRWTHTFAETVALKVAALYKGAPDDNPPEYPKSRGETPPKFLLPNDRRNAREIYWTTTHFPLVR